MKSGALLHTTQSLLAYQPSKQFAAAADGKEKLGSQGTETRTENGTQDARLMVEPKE